VGVGHSLGAVLTADVALRRPEVFSAVVLIDPVMLSPLRLAIWNLIRRLGQAHRVHPYIPGARKRRRRFDSLEAMLARYRRAPVFSRIDAGLRDFVEAAARPVETGEGPHPPVPLPPWTLRGTTGEGGVRGQRDVEKSAWAGPQPPRASATGKAGGSSAERASNPGGTAGADAAGASAASEARGSSPRAAPPEALSAAGPPVELAYPPEWEVAVYENGPLNLWPRLASLKPPLLVIRGAESDTFLPTAVAALRRRLPRAVVHSIPNTGHLVPLEAPQVVADLILAFLKETGN
jgi:pimeloyl-ACP methyl ester carboxylesterase